MLLNRYLLSLEALLFLGIRHSTRLRTRLDHPEVRPSRFTLASWYRNDVLPLIDIH